MTHSPRIGPLFRWRREHARLPRFPGEGAAPAARARRPLPSPHNRTRPARQIAWFMLHLILLGLPLVLLSLACFVVIVPQVAFATDGGLGGLQRGFPAWYAGVLVAGAALARLTWDWVVRGRPLRAGSRLAWWLLLAALLAKSTSWWAMLHFGTELDLRQNWRYLLAGVPLAGCVAHLGWLRWREPVPTTMLPT